MYKKNILASAALIFIGIVFGAVLVSSFGWVRPSMADVKIGDNSEPLNISSPSAQSFNDAFTTVAENVTPSIVRITVVSKSKEDPHSGFRFFMPFNDEMPKEQKGGGSGVIISDEGYILTNNHVVENAVSVTVGLYDKREFQADVIGTDPLTDLAVIKIDADELTVAKLGDSDKLKVGTWVMAIGNPLALTSTVTAGIISAVNRNLNLIRDSYGVEDYIQTDAAINPGNSGGALVNLNGEVIGINSAIATNGLTGSYIGYGFAIPINLAKTVAEDLIANGKVSRGYIGVNISEVNAATAKALGLDKPQGVMIQGIVDGGAASKADIRAGDIILKIDDKEVNMPNELQSYVASKRAGQDVVLTLYRDGETIERTVTLKAREEGSTPKLVDNPHKKKENDEKELKEITFDDLGLTVRNATEDQLAKFKADNGVLVVNVKRFGKAEDQGLASGILISEVNKEKIQDVSELEDVFNDNKGNAVLLKVIYGDGVSRFIGLEIPD